jgi:hypothetical protein
MTVMGLLFTVTRVLAAVYKGLVLIFLIYGLLKDHVYGNTHHQRSTENRRRTQSYQ